MQQGDVHSLQSDVQPPRFLGPFKPLAFRDYRYLWAGHALQAGTWWAEMVTRSIVAYQITGSALHLGALEFVSVIGFVGMGMFGGVLADRFDRRKLLIAMQSWALTVYALLAALVLTDNLQLWHLYAGVMILSIGEAGNQPVRSAAIPSVVPQQYVIGALSLGSMGVNGMRMVTPLTVTLLIQLTGVAGVGFVLCAALYTVIVLCTWRLRLPPHAPRTERVSPLKSVAEGFRYATQNKNILAVLVLSIGPMGFGFAYQAILIVYAITALGGGEGSYSGLVAAIGLGAIIGGSVLASRTKSTRAGSLALAAGAAYGAVLIALGLVGFLPGGAHLFWVAVPFAMVLGACNTGFRASRNTSLLLNTPDHLRGRVMGITLLPEAVQALSALGAGASADTIGAATTMAVLGVACLAVVVFVLAWRPQLRKV